VRLFAGPNGCGKTSLVYTFAKEYSPTGLFHIYRFVNPDEILAQLSHVDGLILDPETDLETLFAALRGSGRISADHRFFSEARLCDSRLTCPAQAADAYVAAAIADFQREALIRLKRSFGFESVMSHPSKVQFLQTARTSGYRTYLYFIATSSPELSWERVKHRVQLGGHAVPEAKLLQRYERSLQLLPQALEYCDRAFIFDNSREWPIKLAEWTPEQELQLMVGQDKLPAWFSRALANVL